MDDVPQLHTEFVFYLLLTSQTFQFVCRLVNIFVNIFCTFRYTCTLYNLELHMWLLDYLLFCPIFASTEVARPDTNQSQIWPIMMILIQILHIYAYLKRWCVLYIMKLVYMTVLSDREKLDLSKPDNGNIIMLSVFCVRFVFVLQKSDFDWIFVCL